MRVWQYLIDKGEQEPTIEEQKAANAKYKKNQRNENKDKELEPLSDKEKWAFSLYKINQRRSLKEKKQKGEFSSIKPWQYLIDKGEQEPTADEQKIATAKYRRNQRNKDEELESLSDKEKWAFSLCQKQTASRKK